MRERLSWALRNARNAMAAYSVSGSLVGIAIGYFNWTQDRAHIVGTSMEQTLRFCFFANAIWSAIFTFAVTLPLFAWLFGAFFPIQNKDKNRTSHKQVFLGLILPCAVLQLLMPALVAVLCWAIPSVGNRLQLLFPGRNLGDVLVWTQWLTLLFGSWIGAVLLAVIFHAHAESSSPDSRLLPVD